MQSNLATAKIAIVMGSQSDWITLQFAAEILTAINVPFDAEIVSAHRTPDKLFRFAEQAADNCYAVIIAGAGGAALASRLNQWRQQQTDEVLNRPDPREQA